MFQVFAMQSLLLRLNEVRSSKPEADILILLHVSVRVDYGLIRHVNEFFITKTKCRLIFFLFIINSTVSRSINKSYKTSLNGKLIYMPNKTRETDRCS